MSVELLQSKFFNKLLLIYNHMMNRLFVKPLRNSKVETLVLKYFKETGICETEDRYEVCLPWLNNHPLIPSNKDSATKRV